MAARKKRMTYDEIVKLLEVYRKNELLWNCSHDHYKNNLKRLEAYNSIQVELNVQSVEEVKRRLKVIRDTYNIEKNKMIESKKSGAAIVYLTKLPWYMIANEFLSGEARESYNNIDGKSANNSITIENPKIEPEDPTSYQQYYSLSPSESEVDPADPIKQYEEVYVQGFAANEPSPRRAARHKRKSIPTTAVGTTPIAASSNVPPHMNSALDMLDTIRSAVAQPIQDEFQYFGLNLAAQLRELPKLRALLLQEKLQKMVSQERIDYETSRITPNESAGNDHADDLF